MTCGTCIHCIQPRHGSRWFGRGFVRCTEIDRLPHDRHGAELRAKYLNPSHRCALEPSRFVLKTEGSDATG